VRKLIAVIGDLANHGSVGVHRGCGFQQVGVLSSCGWKFERWLDVVLMECPLGLADAAHPHNRPHENKTLAVRRPSSGPPACTACTDWASTTWCRWRCWSPARWAFMACAAPKSWAWTTTLSWLLTPLLGIAIAACGLTAIVYGLMDTERWNRRFNASAPADAKAGQSSWLTIFGVGLSSMLGATALVATTRLAFSATLVPVRRWLGRVCAGVGARPDRAGGWERQRWIKLMTMKVSKGLDFSVVALPGVGHMPANGRMRRKRRGCSMWVPLGLRRSSRLGEVGNRHLWAGSSRGLVRT